MFHCYVVVRAALIICNDVPLLNLRNWDVCAELLTVQRVHRVQRSTGVHAVPAEGEVHSHRWKKLLGLWTECVLGRDSACLRKKDACIAKCVIGPSNDVSI